MSGDFEDFYTVVIEATNLRETKNYYTAGKDAVTAISIKGVVNEEAEEPEISATMFQSKWAKMSLLLAKNHKQVVNQVCEKSKLDSLRLANGLAEARYEMVVNDYHKF